MIRFDHIAKKLAFNLIGAGTVLIASLTVSAQVSNQSEKWLLQDAGSAITSGDTIRAEDELQLILHASPHSYQAMDLLGILRAQEKREPEAEQIFRNVIRDQPGFAGAHIHLGLLNKPR